MSEANKAIVREIEEAWNSNQLERLDPLFAADFKSHAGITPDAGLESAKQAHTMSMQAFPDRKTAIQDMVAEGDRVVVRVRMTGTNTGGLPWFNVPANGNKVDIEWISIYRLADGKVVEHHAAMDRGALLQQLGAAGGGVPAA